MAKSVQALKKAKIKVGVPPETDMSDVDTVSKSSMALILYSQTQTASLFMPLN